MNMSLPVSLSPTTAALDVEQSLDIESASGAKTLVIACGALARELIAVIRLNGLIHLSVTCLPAIWHNTPDKITEGVRAKIIANREQYERILCLYGDCGTGGTLDAMLKEEGVERIDGNHCYAFFAGLPEFDAMMEEEIGSFFLTDYLARFFDRLIIDGLKLDIHPELRDMIFGHYKRIVYLAQTDDAELRVAAQRAADRLGLELVVRYTGYGNLIPFLNKAS